MSFNVSQSSLGYNKDCVHIGSFSPEVFKLFGHFRTLCVLDLLSIASLGVLREEIWTVSVFESADKE